MKIAITGHRPNKLGNDYDLKSVLIMQIKKIILEFIHQDRFDNEQIEFIIGMALGIDTLFARIAIEYNIPFIAAVPFRGQESVWPNKSKVEYYNILKKAHSIYLCDEQRSEIASYFNVYNIKDIHYSAEKMQIRNKWMVDNCDILIAVWDLSSGGTKNCVMYAKSINKEIFHIIPKLLA